MKSLETTAEDHMKRSMRLGWWGVIAAVVLAAGCEDKAVLANEWERHVVDAQGREFDAALNFAPDGILQFELLSAASGHTATLLKYRVDGNRIVFYDDPECGTEGHYRYDITGSTLTLTAEEDACAPRRAILHAAWTER